MTKFKQIIKKLSDKICMDFGLETCSVVHTKLGNIVELDCVADIPTLSGEDNYKYLGILEYDNILHKNVKAAIFA